MHFSKRRWNKAKGAFADIDVCLSNRPWGAGDGSNKPVSITPQVPSVLLSGLILGAGLGLILGLAKAFYVGVPPFVGVDVAKVVVAVLVADAVRRAFPEDRF